MRLGDQAEGGLLVVVVVVGVVHDAQVHGKDGCGGGGHLHGQRCRAHIHCNTQVEADEKRQKIREEKSFFQRQTAEKKQLKLHLFNLLQSK